MHAPRILTPVLSYDSCMPFFDKKEIQTGHAESDTNFGSREELQYTLKHYNYFHNNLWIMHYYTDFTT